MPCICNFYWSPIKFIFADKLFYLRLIVTVICALPSVLREYSLEILLENILSRNLLSFHLNWFLIRASLLFKLLLFARITESLKRPGLNITFMALLEPRKILWLKDIGKIGKIYFFFWNSMYNIPAMTWKNSKNYQLNSSSCIIKANLRELPYFFMQN